MLVHQAMYSSVIAQGITMIIFLICVAAFAIAVLFFGAVLI